MISPFSPPSSTDIRAWKILSTLLPWIFEFALLLRLAAVYPPRTTTRGLMAMLFAVPIAVKVARLGVLATFAARWNEDSNTSSIFTLTEITLKKYPFLRVEWGLQILDSLYVLPTLRSLHSSHPVVPASYMVVVLLWRRNERSDASASVSFSGQYFLKDARTL
jgi:hypothetical protein